LHFQKNATEVVGDALKVGSDATQEAAKIRVKALGAAPSILEQKVAFAQWDLGGFLWLSLKGSPLVSKY